MIHAYPVFLNKYPNTQEQKPLAPLTSLKIGGNADLYLEVEDMKDLLKILKDSEKLQIPVFIIGGGSNLVFSEYGFRGLILKIKSSEIKIKNNLLFADAGALMSSVIQTALKNNLSGIEKLTGIPGTIGGAVRGNAGSFGVEIKDVVKEVTIIDKNNQIKTVDNKYLNFGYRTSKIKEEDGQIVILKVTLLLEHKSDEELQKDRQKVQEIIKARAGSQPTGKVSGSLFKNPSAEFAAGYLLDQCGCKGLKVGQAQVSKQHANWIVNLGDATQGDIIELSNLMKEKVKKKFNIDLEAEVQFVSESGSLRI